MMIRWKMLSFPPFKKTTSRQVASLHLGGLPAGDGVDRVERGLERHVDEAMRW
jgi:hypothetical protein